MANISAALHSARFYASLSGFQPDAADSHYHQWYNNYSSILTEFQLIAYVNEYFYVKHWEFVCGTIQSYMFVLFSAIGFIGYVIQSIILRDSAFRIVTFWYQKAEVWLELIHMAFLFCHGLYSLTPPHDQSIFWIYLGGQLSNVFNKILILTTDCIIFFVCLERFVAIMFPMAFDKINNRPFAAMAIGISILLGWLFGVDFAKLRVEQTHSGYVMRANEEFGKFADFIKFRDAFQLAKGYAICLLTIMLVGGLIKLSQKRKSISNCSAADKAKSKANVQICILSICYGIPVTINSVVYVVYNQGFSAINGAVSYAGIQPLKCSTYQQCQQQLHTDKTRAWLLLLVNFTMCQAHCIHFYINLLFSPMFRRVFDAKAKKSLSDPRVQHDMNISTLRHSRAHSSAHQKSKFSPVALVESDCG